MALSLMSVPRESAQSIRVLILARIRCDACRRFPNRRSHSDGINSNEGGLMPLKRRMAVTLPASPFVKDTIERVRWAEANGYTDAWFGDGGAPDALTMAAALGGVAPTVRIGVAVTPVYTRTPAVLAA